VYMDTIRVYVYTVNLHRGNRCSDHSEQNSVKVTIGGIGIAWDGLY